MPAKSSVAGNKKLIDKIKNMGGFGGFGFKNITF
jgi:hypothetical protein